MNRAMPSSTHEWRRWIDGVNRLMEDTSTREDTPTPEPIARNLVSIPVPGSTEVIPGQLIVSVCVDFAPMTVPESADRDWLVQQYRQQLDAMSARMQRELEDRFMGRIADEPTRPTAVNPTDTMAQVMAARDRIPALTYDEVLTTLRENAMLNTDEQSARQSSPLASRGATSASSTLREPTS